MSTLVETVTEEPTLALAHHLADLSRKPEEQSALVSASIYVSSGTNARWKNVMCTEICTIEKLSCLRIGGCLNSTSMSATKLLLPVNRIAAK